jgi:hypothetical protein
LSGGVDYDRIPDENIGSCVGGKAAYGHAAVGETGSASRRGRRRRSREGEEKIEKEEVERGGRGAGGFAGTRLLTAVSIRIARVRTK